MTKKIIIISTIVVNILLAACAAPDEFVLNRSGKMIAGLNMSHLDSVEVRWDNAILLHGGGKAALKFIQTTQHISDFTVNINDGYGVRFALRTVSNNYDIHPAFVFDYTTDGCIFRENGKVVRVVDSIKAAREFPVRIIIKNDGKNIRITVDCDIVYNSTTELPATEYIILESLSNSNVYLSGINFDEVLESNELLFENREEILLPVHTGK